MYSNLFNKREPIKFKRFLNKGYALFSCLGKVVIVGTLSVSTLTYAKADGISTRTTSIDPVDDDKEVMLENVEVTGSLAPLTLGKAARMVTVLSREEIQAAPVQSINDLLKYAVGVDVRQRGALGAQTDIGIRGGTQEQVAVLLNGIDITDPQTGHNSVEYPVDLSEIERIEIIEGPASRLFGTSSLVGAINIVTKTADKSSLDLNTEGGSFGYFTIGGRTNIKTGNWNNQISGSYKRSDGYNRAKSGALNTDYEGGKAFYQGVYDDRNINVKWHAGMSMKDFGSNSFYGAGSDTQFEHVAKVFTALQGETKTLWLHIKPAVYWNHTYDRFEYFKGSEEYVPFNHHRTNVFGAKANFYFDTSLGRTAFGADYRNEDIISGNLGEPLDHPKGSGNGKSSITVQTDTSRSWVSENFTIGQGGGQGGGTLSVGEAASHIGEKGVWVAGYIVGGDLTSAGKTVKTEGINKNTHLALADRSSITDKASCLAVELPAGKVRQALNLVDHPELIGKRVKVKGDLVDKYFGTVGLKSTTDYEMP